MKKEELNKILEAWKIKREQMPLRDFIITFTMEDGKEFVAVVNEKDEYDIKKKWEGQKYLEYQNAENIKKTFTLVKDKIMYVEIEAR